MPSRANERLFLFIYRFTENHTSFELEQWLLGQSPLLNPIDFGKSDVFAVSESGDGLLVNDQRSSTLTIQLARQLSGKLSQGYVRGPQVWADRLDTQGKVNQQLDDDENFTNSSPDGDYDLAPGYLDCVLMTEGGFSLGASGTYIPAAPMMATLPEDRQVAVHITPLTTLVTANPELRSILAQSGDWRTDIASPLEIPGNLLRVAKVAEAAWMLLSGGSNPIMQSTQQQLGGLSILANKLAQGEENAILEDLPSLVGKL